MRWLYSNKLPYTLSMTTLVTCCCWFSRDVFVAVWFFGVVTVVVRFRSRLLSSGLVISGIISISFWYHYSSCGWTCCSVSWHFPSSILPVLLSDIFRRRRSLGESGILPIIGTLGDDSSFWWLFSSLRCVASFEFLPGFFVSLPLWGRGFPRGSLVQWWCRSCHSMLVGFCISFLLLWWVIWMRQFLTNLVFFYMLPLCGNNLIFLLIHYDIVIVV